MKATLQYPACMAAFKLALTVTHCNRVRTNATQQVATDERLGLAKHDCHKAASCALTLHISHCEFFRHCYMTVMIMTLTHMAAVHNVEVDVVRWERWRERSQWLRWLVAFLVVVELE